MHQNLSSTHAGEKAFSAAPRSVQAKRAGSAWKNRRVARRFCAHAAHIALCQAHNYTAALLALDGAKKMKTLRLEPNKAESADESESRRAIITVLLLLLRRLTCVTHTHKVGWKGSSHGCEWVCVCIGIRQVTQMKIIPLNSHVRRGTIYFMYMRVQKRSLNWNVLMRQVLYWLVRDFLFKAASALPAVHFSLKATLANFFIPASELGRGLQPSFCCARLEFYSDLQ